MPTIPAKPYFALAIQSGNCSAEFRVNDVPVLSLEDTAAVTIPVNLFMVSGANEIRVDVNPRPADGVQLSNRLIAKANLIVGAMHEPEEPTDILTGITFKKPNSEELIGAEESHQFSTNRPVVKDSGRGGFTITRIIDLRVPFGPWSWLSSDQIENNDETKAELFREYALFWQLLSTGETEAIQQALETSAKETAAAFYLPNLESGHAKLGVFDLLNDRSQTLAPLPKMDDLTLEVFGSKRLARLVDEEGDSPIAFEDKDELFSIVELMFAKFKDGWSQVR